MADQPPGSDRHETSRRQVFLAGAGALAGVLGLGTLASFQFLSPWERRRAEDRIVVGYPEDIPPDGILLFPSSNIMVGRHADGYFALSTICPHLGCVVRWIEDEQRFHCPCHGSKFEMDGKVLNGPAVKNLPPLELAVDDQGRLVVDRSS